MKQLLLPLQDNVAYSNERDCKKRFILKFYFKTSRYNSRQIYHATYGQTDKWTNGLLGKRTIGQTDLQRSDLSGGAVIAQDHLLALASQQDVQGFDIAVDEVGIVEALDALHHSPSNRHHHPVTLQNRCFTSYHLEQETTIFKMVRAN